jgi:hypothetical protein
MLADKLRLYALATSIVAEQSVNLVLIEGARPIRRFKFLTFDRGTTTMQILAGKGLPESCAQNGVMPKSPFTHRQR